MTDRNSENQYAVEIPKNLFNVKQLTMFLNELGFVFAQLNPGYITAKHTEKWLVDAVIRLVQKRVSEERSSQIIDAQQYTNNKVK